ncbi:MAG: hypothetical protein WED05_03490 [Candidatus Atabeyarchaeum deiterrae]
MFDRASEPEGTAESFRKLFSDPIVKRLLKDSNLTKIQFETLLINSVFDEMVGKDGGMYDKKASSRVYKESFRAWHAKSYPKGVSRGAFRRVLFQASRNVIRSIYTLFLLGYIGILETPGLQGYMELSEMVTEYKRKMEQRQQKNLVREPLGGEALKLLEKSLLKIIDQYAYPFTVLGKGNNRD